jgi:Protein of unknown function (DUF3046)
VNVAFCREEPAERHVHLLAGPEAAVLAGLERDVSPHGGQYPVQVRLTEFWARMREQFGEVYAQSVAKDFVFAKLGDRTIERALADGEDTKLVWRAVVDTFDVPQRLR